MVQQSLDCQNRLIESVIVVFNETAIVLFTLTVILVVVKPF